MRRIVILAGLMLVMMCNAVSASKLYEVSVRLVPNLKAATVTFINRNGTDKDSCLTDERINNLYTCKISAGNYEISIFPEDVQYLPIENSRVAIKSGFIFTAKLEKYVYDPKVDTLYYKVFSTCPTDVTYTIGSSVQQEDNVSSGWKTDSIRGNSNYIAAQLRCKNGSVTVYITLAGKLVNSATSSGSYAIATAKYP